MGIEIEKKFLLIGDEWRGLGKSKYYRQGYLNVSKNRVVRVRTIESPGGSLDKNSNENKGFLTIKGINTGASRLEYEYEIPFNDSQEMLDRLVMTPILEKKRFEIEYQGFVWEVDEFLGENKGLVVAEVELDSEEQIFEKPSWVGKEVTGNPKYYNSNLINSPFSKWK